MNLFEEIVVAKFDALTGEPLAKPKTKRASQTVCCDYCGTKLSKDFDEFEDSVPVSYQLHEEGGSEESWYYMDPPSRPDGKRVSLSSIFRGHEKFMYCPDCERRLMAESLATVKLSSRQNLLPKQAIDQIKDFLKENGLGKMMDDPRSLSYAMCEARLRVVTKLLKEHSLEALGLEPDD